MTNLLRLVACLFLCVSLNSFGAILYGFDNQSNNIFAHNLSTNQRTFVTEINHDSITFEGDYGITYAPAPVPLPAGIYLFLSGLVGLGLMRGRNG